MAIKLDKEGNDKKAVDFTDEDFANINLNNIKDNKRIFIPYDELPDSDELRCSYLESLISFIERKTGKHYSYFFVQKTEPYEVTGFYIQTAPELKDRNGKYVTNNDFVYDRNGIKWNVNYYYKNNMPCILIDNDTYGYVVVSSLSEFSLNPDDDFAEADEKDSGNYLIEENKDNGIKSFNIGAVVAGVIFGLVMIVILVLIATRLPEAFNEVLSDILKETANTPTGDEADLISAIKNAWGIVKVFLPKLLLTSLALSILLASLKMLKRLMGRY